MLNAKALQKLFPFSSKEFIYKTIKRLKTKHKLTYDESLLPLHVIKDEFNLTQDDVETLLQRKEK